MVYGTIKVAALGTVMAGVIAAQSSGAHAEQILRGESGNPGAASHAILTVFSKIAAREAGVSIQINDSQTLTKSTLRLGEGKIDITPMPPSVFAYLSSGTRMYRKIPDKAKKASENVRGILGFLANFFHPVVFENVNIKSWADIKGKRVFTGPPSGAAAVNAEAIIRIASGLEPNKDYKAIKMNWGSGLQAMMDGQLDLYMRPAGVGAALIEQLGLKRKFRLLSLTDDMVKSSAWKKYEKVPGRGVGTIPAQTYKGQLGDNDVIVAANAITLIVNKNVSNELVYKMTKGFWSNLKEVHASVNVLKTVNPKDPVNSVFMPLHAGAWRYYQEAGMPVPASLKPPEAK